MRFQGKHVLLTGASSGIGRAALHAFVAEGAVVLAVGRNAARLDAARSSSPDPERVLVSVADVGVPEQARGIVAEAVDAFGRLHVLVNNAGIATSGSVLECTEATWDETLAINLSGSFHAAQMAARHMVEQGGGAIVNVASTDAFSAESPQVAYNVSKAGVVMLTKSFAHELGHLGVRVNAVAPGETLTPMVAEEMADPAFAREYLRGVPMRRASRPEEQAAVILFLASDDASYVTGATVLADGGQLAGTWYDPRDVPPVP
jgi:NAD(P)-dependent dehydrogenase (short-subunit alcohol dehydrogenase family)